MFGRIMLKWAVGKDDHPTTKSLRKRLKHGDMQRDAQVVGLINCCKHRSSNNPQGPSRIVNKNRVRVDVGVINNNNNHHQCLNNESDNGKVNGLNYKVPDQSSPSPISSTSTESSDTTPHYPHHHPYNNNNNNIINADSKSLIYMQLESLPMAIVKQITKTKEKLQHAPQSSNLLPTKSVLKSHSSANNSNNHPNNRAQSSKIKNQKQVSPQHKKPHSKSITFKDDVNENSKTKGKPLTSTEVRKACPTPILKAPEISIKEAHTRPLKALSSTLPTPTHNNRKTPPNTLPEIFNQIPSHKLTNPKKVAVDNSNSSKRKPDLTEEKCPELPAKKSALLICDKEKAGLSTNPIPSFTYPKSNSIIKRSDANKSVNNIQENNENDPDSGGGGCNSKVRMMSQNHNQVPTTLSENPVSSKPHDTTDPQFLEKPITYSTPPVSKCAKKLTLKRSELKKLERLKSQTERLNRFLKKYYHDCLPNLPEEEDEQCSPEEKSLSILRTHWREVKSPSSREYSSSRNFLGGESEMDESCCDNVLKHNYYRNRFPYSSPRVNNKFNPLQTYSHLPELSVDDYSVTWENLLNTSPSMISFSNEATTGMLPIIQEDSGEVSSSTNNSEHHKRTSSSLIPHHEKEVGRRREMRMDESYLMSSRTRIETDDSLVVFTKESLGLSEQHDRDRMSDNFNTKISYEDDESGGEEEGGFGMKKLKALVLDPLGELFDLPASLAEDEGFMSPKAYSPVSTSSSGNTFNRFSVSSSSGKSSAGEEEHEHLGDGNGCNKEESNLIPSSSQSLSSSEADQVTSSEEGGPKYIIMGLKQENANYLPAAEESSKSCNHNETWNSHGYVPTSPCGTISLNSHHSSSTNSSPIPGALNERENDHEEESFICNRLALAFSTPQSKSLLQTSLRGNRLRAKKSTPRKLVRKPPVNSAFSGKGELLIRTYKNDGDYVTVHVVQARRLEAHSQSSWKLMIKVSLLPEPETTLTRSSEAILIGRNKSWVKIDQKFSFEVPSSCRDKPNKIFLSAVKRHAKKSSFLGWATLDLSTEEKTQSWLKLRKRKMSTTTYPKQTTSHSNSNCAPKGGQEALENNRPSSSMDSPSPQPGGHTDGSSTSSRCDYEMEPKSQLQNSSTMDSGVEDCCEPPPPPAPSIDLDDKNGQRITVKMIKQEGTFAFSVVWVSPPRVERIEKGKSADVAGLKIGDLIIAVNGEDVTTVPNTTIYTKMKTTGSTLQLEVWRTTPPIQSRNHQRHHNPSQFMDAGPSVAPHRQNSNINDNCQEVTPVQQSPCAACLPQPASVSKSSTTNVNIKSNQNLKTKNMNQSPVPPPSRIQSLPPPPSILKPPPPVPPQVVHPPLLQVESQQTTGSSSWKIRFNIELLDNEDDCLKQFLICELKFFRKIVAALDRYLIPAQSNRLLTPQEINLMFSNVIKIITVTKRILNCVANGSSSPDWNLGEVLCSTHSDHMPEIEVAYSTYAKTLGCAAMILSEKMSLQEFAKFVLETPVPKGHLDLTSLLFAPLEHLRNICEICEEISHNSDKWLVIFNRLKGLYADIVCETDFMEPISHVSMKKNPLLSVRDLEKRVVSTSCQPVKVCEKGRRWLFGSRLFKKESDGSWTPVWAFLFTDIIVLTSHATRDRVFFVKEAPIRLEDVVTLHFNFPKKHENDFRLLFGSEPIHQSRLDKLLPIHRNKKSNQIALRAPNIQLKSMWKLLLQRQIITLNTRLSKSASSNFSISEFCERFPITPQCEDDELLPLQKKRPVSNSNLISKPCGSTLMPQNPISSEERNLSVINEEKICVESKPQPQPRQCAQQQYVPDGLSSLSKDLIKNRVTKPSKVSAVEPISEEIMVAFKPRNDPSDTIVSGRDSPKSANDKTSCVKTTRNDQVVTTSNTSELIPSLKSETKIASTNPTSVLEKLNVPLPSTSKQGIGNNNTSVSPSPVNNNNNNEIRDFNHQKSGAEKCPCVIVQEKAVDGVRPDVLAREAAQKGKTDKECFPNNKTCLSNVLNNVEQVKEFESKNPPGNVGSPKVDSPRPVSRQEEMRLQKNVNSSSPSPSPSMSNNRVEALKSEVVGSIGKPKPAPRIMTNSTLKSRQQEMLSQKEGQTIITMVEKPSGSSGHGTDCILISQHIEPRVVTTKDASSSPLLNAPRCQSENGFIKSKPVHTDSPILTGYGSEKSRRRILYDYKVQRDYPELFGITPKDRRSYIKQLAEKQPENDKALVAPYYFSPLPTPKFPKKVEMKPPIMPCLENEVKGVVNGTLKNNLSDPQNNFHILANGVKKDSPPKKPIRSKFMAEHLKESLPNKVEKVEEKVEKVNGRDEMSLKEIARGMLGIEHSDEDSEDSDDSECHEDVQAQVHRQRSPEESSNDSGISDEVTDKSKTIVNGNGHFQSTMAANSSEVKFSTKLNHSIIKHCDKMQLLPKNAHACNSTPMQSNKIDHVYFEGEEKTRMEAVVAANVLKADKCTETDDDLFHFPHHNISNNNNNRDKNMRILMAERREAFFASTSSTAACFSYYKPIPEYESPLKVKIVDGNTIHTTKTTPKPRLISPPSERVQLMRLPEKERNARVERVESSDDSTSSDLASASPAAENGTTDPSWSSSSSSLAGYNSSKEEPSTTSTGTSIFNSCPVNSIIQVASTSSLAKILMSDFTNGLPTSSNFCNLSNGSLCNNGPEIVVTQESPETPTMVQNGCGIEGEEEEILFQEKPKHNNNSSCSASDYAKRSFLRVGSNDSTVENYGDDDDYDDEEELSQCSVATINRYGTFESLEKIENEDSVEGLPDFSRTMTRSKARFTFEDDDSDSDLFEEDFESDFNFRFPSQIQDNTYSVSRLGPLPPLLEEDFEDENFDEQRADSPASDESPGTSSLENGSTLRARHETGLRHDNNGFLLARLATMYARSSISPLKILRDLWLKKRYRQSENWKYKE